MSTSEIRIGLAPNASVTVSLADRIADLGGISSERVRTVPAPGTATLRDLIDVNSHGDQLYELVDGTLVEKAMGWRESLLAMVIVRWLGNFLEVNPLGVVTGPDGMTRLFGKTVRGPDVAFVSWERLPAGKLPDEPVPLLVPDFVVEVLSVSNTRAEMARKRREYFQAGVRLVWMVDLQVRTVAIYSSAESVRVATEKETIDGGNVLPGWQVNLAQLFDILDRSAETS
jgi:Uma2 family endonuclease